MEQLYSEAAGKFLADRFVSGTCPKCGYEVRESARERLESATTLCGEVGSFLSASPTRSRALRVAV